jgi:hypothetical protein
MTTSATANARVRGSLVFPNGMKRLLNEPGSARVPLVIEDRVVDDNPRFFGGPLVHRRLDCDQPSGRITQTKFAVERNLDLNQEYPRTLAWHPWL